MYESSLGRYRDDDCSGEDVRAVIGKNALFVIRCWSFPFSVVAY